MERDGIYLLCWIVVIVAQFQPALVSKLLHVCIEGHEESMDILVWAWRIVGRFPIREQALVDQFAETFLTLRELSHCIVASISDLDRLRRLPRFPRPSLPAR